MSDVRRASGSFNKDELVYTIMIRQPDFINEETIQKAFEITQKKKPHPFLNEVYYDEIEDGDSVQIMHIASYDDEPAPFEKMKAYIKQINKDVRSPIHREIYLSNAASVSPEKMKTILRYPIQ